MCLEDLKKKYPLYKICFGMSAGGCREHPRCWVANGAEGGVCSEQLSQLHFTKARQTVPKGHFLCSLDERSTKQLFQLFRGPLDMRCVLGCLAEDSSSPKGRASVT